jgi:carboxylesterase
MAPVVRVLIASVVLAGQSTAQSRETTYAQSVAAIARRQAVDDSVAAPGARSILLTTGAHTSRVVVLLHGLTDSPRQFEAFGTLLHADGNNVYVPRLPQHGLRGKDAGALGALTSTQLQGVADSVVREVEGLGDSIIVVGLSMGGTVGAWIAQERNVARVVLIAPAIEPGRIPSLLDRPLIGLADHLPGLTRRSAPDSGRPDREPGFNSRAIAEILELGRSVAAQADRGPARANQVTLLVNASDRTVKESAAEGLARAWLRHGTDVVAFELPDSLRLPHNIIDPIRGRIGGDAVLDLLRDLAFGLPAGPLARRIPLR